LPLNTKAYQTFRMVYYDKCTRPIYRQQMFCLYYDSRTTDFAYQCSRRFNNNIKIHFVRLLTDKSSSCRARNSCEFYSNISQFVMIINCYVVFCIHSWLLDYNTTFIHPVDVVSIRVNGFRTNSWKTKRKRKYIIFLQNKYGYILNTSDSVGY